MNTKLFLPFALALPMLAVSCDKAADAADGAKEAMELTADNAGAQATKAVTALTSGLAGLGDMTDVGKMTEKVKGLMGSADILAKIKSTMPNIKLPAMDGIGSAVTSLTEKFSGNEGIMKVLTPLLEKLKGLMG